MVEPLAVASWLTPTSLFVLLNIVIGFIAVTSAFASRRTEHLPPPEHHQHHHQIHHHESPKTLLRAPSLFSRVTSFNFSNQYSFDEPHNPPISHASSFFSRMTSFNRSVDESHESEIHNPNSAAIQRAPSLIARLTSFNRFSVESETNPVEKDENQAPIARAPSLLSRMASINFSLHRSTEPDPSPAATPVPAVEAREQHVTRSATEPKKKRKIPLAENKMKKSSSEKDGKKMETTSFGHEEVDAKADDFINKFKQQLRLQRLDSLLRYRNSAGGS